MALWKDGSETSFTQRMRDHGHNCPFSGQQGDFIEIIFHKREGFIKMFFLLHKREIIFHKRGIMGKVLYRTVLTHIHRGAFSPPLANCPVFIKMKEITFTFPYSWQVSATITITDSNQYLISVLSGVALGADLNLRRYGDARNWWMCTHPISGLFNSRGLLAKIVAKVTKVVKIVAKVSLRNYALILKRPPPRAHTQNMEKVKDYGVALEEHNLCAKRAKISQVTWQFSQIGFLFHIKHIYAILAHAIYIA